MNSGELTDDELTRAATCARERAFRHECEAEKSESAKAPHLDQARRFHELAKRLEAARKASRGN